MMDLNILMLEKSPSQKILKRITIISLIMTILTWLIMTIVTIGNTTIYGVFDLEFAFTTEKMDVILQTWGDEIIMGELIATFVDFGFLSFYSTFLACLTLIITRRFDFSEKTKKIGYYLCILPFIAAILDAVENINLLLVLSSPLKYPEFAPIFASIFATIKFSLIIVVVIFDISMPVIHKIKG